MIKQGDKIAICRECGKTSNEFSFQVRDTTLAGIEEVGLVCPNCNEWYHSYFADDKLKQIANRVPQMQRQERRKHLVTFNKLQKKIRRKLNMKKVGKRWIREEDNGK